MGEWERRTNEYGNAVRSMFVDGSRYPFDERLLKNGFRQYDTDQDAWYFGVWVHVERREVWTYCEGDVSVVECPTLEGFRAELQHMADFYGPPPPAFTVLDLDAKTVTRVYDTRPEA